MTDAPEPEPTRDPEAVEPAPPALKDRDAWKDVYFGQLARDLVPYHPDPPEAPEDELTRAALEDPDGPTRGDHLVGGNAGLWRVLAMVGLAVVALGLVFWLRGF